MILFIRKEKLIAFFKVLICLLTVMLLLRLLSFTAAAQTSDVKNTTEPAQKYETHNVLKGETLYSLAKEHAISIDKLLELNPQIINNNLETGTDIKLPVKEYAGIGPKPYLAPAYYKVSQGETLYSIGKKTGNGVEVLKMWNDLKTNNIGIGQKLIVGYSEGNTAEGTTATAEETTAEETTAEETETTGNNRSTEAPKENKSVAATTKAVRPAAKASEATKRNGNTAGAVNKNTGAPKIQPANVDMKNTTAAVADKNGTTASVYSSSKTDEKLVYMTQKGLCTWIRGNSDNGKFYALHPYAPIGSSVSVKNMMNSKSVKVKVIGRLPATPENENIAIKISGSAAKQLGAVDDKFLVSLSYMGYESDKATTMK